MKTTHEIATEISALKDARRAAACHTAGGQRDDWSDADADNLATLERVRDAAALALTAWDAAAAADRAAYERRSTAAKAVDAARATLATLIAEHDAAAAAANRSFAVRSAAFTAWDFACTARLATSV